jgi:hypothetical protein
MALPIKVTTVYHRRLQLVHQLVVVGLVAYQLNQLAAMEQTVVQEFLFQLQGHLSHTQAVAVAAVMVAVQVD